MNPIVPLCCSGPVKLRSAGIAHLAQNRSMTPETRPFSAVNHGLRPILPTNSNEP
ncbi:hypothetical protein GQ44DRAFT_712930 [Phaeosphaeriaceae sp. PMI808]|nr:hypothetical protein GQ44DRAFT_712930 [Phaeosphaeriaceae sp. PMI808]